MMNMLIQIDEKRIIKERKYRLDDVWRVLNARFDRYGCIKERQEDGAMLYKGNPEKDYFTCMMLAAIQLKHQKWFGRYCTKWILYDNDDDEELPFQDIDILSRERQKNPLFQQDK